MLYRIIMQREPDSHKQVTATATTH